MTDTTKTTDDQRTSVSNPIYVLKDGVKTLSLPNILKEIKNLEMKSSTPNRLKRLVHFTSIVNRHAITRVYREMQEPDKQSHLVLKEASSLWWDFMNEMPDDSKDKEYGDKEASLRLGKAVACGAHMYLHKIYDNARYSSEKGKPLNLVGQVARYEQIYLQWLRASQRATKSLDSELLEIIYHEIHEEVYGEYGSLISSVGALSWEDRGFKSIGLRASQLGRKMSFLMASMIYLRARMVTKSSRNGIVKIATSRAKLLRRVPNVQLSFKGLKGLKDYTRLTIASYVKDIQWINRGDKPYSFAQEINEDYNVRLYYRSMMRSGMSANIWIWTKGKKETKEGVDTVVAEREGSGQHQGTHWEDYLATELNDHYNLYPGSLHMEWEFPVIGKQGAINDLIARIKE